MHHDYIEAGFKVFGLYGMDANGKCECGNPDCEALYKHPRVSNWQHTPDWSKEQLDFMEETKQFNTGFGVLCDGFLVIDVDPRNGGVDGYAKLCADTGIDFKDTAGMVVYTGGHGWHIYFKNENNLALVGKLKDYPGVDFKSSGFVVGAGSMHKSGSTYELESGYPDEIKQAPAKLLEILKKEHAHKTDFEGVVVEVTDQQIIDMLGSIDANCDYDQWIAVGMSIHEATGGDGFEIWDRWSSLAANYDDSVMSYKWHSFGKSGNPVTFGTLHKLAEEGGYKQSVTFETTLTQEPEPEYSDHPVPMSDIDLLRPQALVGKVAKWINQQSRYPREHLAVAAAISAVGNIGGLRHFDIDFEVTANTFIFCVAGSSTGKESIQQSQAELHSVSGFGGATYGGIKSEQEVIRNLLNHQPGHYIIDEFGILLQKIENARKKGSSAYLEGVIAVLMSAYSKANKNLLLGGDVTKDAAKLIIDDIAKCKKKISENIDTTRNTKKAEDLTALHTELTTIGLRKPFLSLIGYTTPVTFNQLVSYESSTNGFIARSIIVSEKETNPMAKKNFKPVPMHDGLKMELMSLANGGSCDALDYNQRIEYRKEQVNITSAPDALISLDKIQEFFWQYAEMHKSKTGLEAIVRRGFEQVLKISFILGMSRDTKRRTEHDVRWSYAYVRRDIDAKLALASANIAEEAKDVSDALLKKIITMLDKEVGHTLGAVTNRHRKLGKENVQKALEFLESKGRIKVEEYKHKFNKKTIKNYYLV